MLFIMSSKTVKVSMESYFKLNVDRNFSSDSPNSKEMYRKSRGNVSEFVNTEREFAGRMEAENLFYVEFIDRTVSTYSTKFAELLYKQEAEKDTFRKEFIQNVKFEVEKWQKCINCIVQEEEKLIEQIIKLRKMYSSREVNLQIARKLVDMHRDFFKKYEEIIIKHKSEVRSLEEVLNEEVRRMELDLP